MSWMGAPSSNQFCSRYIERVINQRLHSFPEADRVGQLCVQVEGCFISPARMNVEELWIAGRAKSIDAEAAGFRAGWSDNFAQCFSNCIFLALAGMKSRENE